jgi:hypothetical protein
MSLYNMLHGQNDNADVLLAMLGLTKGDCGRFRDCFLDKKENGNFSICVYTRNGGGNREDYQETIDTMAKSPFYLTDYDDDFDCTYATIEFSVPEQFKKHVDALYDEQDKRSPEEKWKDVYNALGAMVNKP